MNKLLVQKKSLPEVLDISRTTVEKLINNNLFPPSVGYIASRRAWAVRDLELWIELGMPSKREFTERKKSLTNKEKAY